MDNVNIPLAAAALVFLVSELLMAAHMRKQGKHGLAKMLLFMALWVPAILLLVAFGVIGDSTSP